MQYDFKIEETVKKIKSSKAKTICLQLADGLKPQSDKIKEELETRTNAKVIIWADTCFGACDLPLEIQKMDIDLLIQYGHAPWKD